MVIVMTWIKKNDSFLPDFSKETLNQLYRKEKNAKAKLRLLALIQRKEGKTLDEIASSLKKPKTTIHDWLLRMENGKIDGIHDIKQKGKATKLNQIQLKELDEILGESPTKQGIPFKLWTTTLIQYVIFKRFAVSYNQSAIWKITTKMGYNLKVPRQQNKKANKKAKELFKEELKKKFNIMLNLDSRSFVLMKHTSQYNHT